MVPTSHNSGLRTSQHSEIDSLVTVAEYQGTQCDNYTNYELSAAKKDLALVGEGTIGSLGSEIQMIVPGKKTQQDAALQAEKLNFPKFKKKGNGEIEADEMGEMTSLSEMEMSNVHDCSLD